MMEQFLWSPIQMDSFCVLKSIIEAFWLGTIPSPHSISHKRSACIVHTSDSRKQPSAHSIGNGEHKQELSFLMLNYLFHAIFWIMFVYWNYSNSWRQFWWNSSLISFLVNHFLLFEMILLKVLFSMNKLINCI